VIGKKVLEFDYLISVEDDIGFQIVFVDVSHELAAISARRQNVRFC